MNTRVVAMLAAKAIVVVAAASNGRGVVQETKPLETALGYYLEGTAAWRQENAEYVKGGEAPRFWIREYRWGPGRDVLLADAFAVFDGDRCEPLVHFVYTWDASEERVANQTFGASGMHIAGSSWRESSTTLVTEAEGQLPNGSTIRLRDVTDLSDPHRAVSVGYRWEGEGWVALDTARWDQAPARVCS